MHQHNFQNNDKKDGNIQLLDTKILYHYNSNNFY